MDTIDTLISSAQRVVRVPELLSMILSDSSLSNRDTSAAACVSRDWNEMANDIMYQDTSLETLIKKFDIQDATTVVCRPSC
jgi:hypothetical protein